MKNCLRNICIALIGSVAFAIAARADLENENLLAELPAGYKVDFQQRKGNTQITEMVPSNESVQNWTEMVTVQVFYGLKDVTPEQFKGRIEQLYSSACPGSQTKPLGQGTERGYATGTWVMLCPLNGQTGKPENTWFKAIQGRDSFYVVQKAYKFTPSKEQESKWLGFLKNVSVCDSRLADRACPKTKQ